MKGLTTTAAVPKDWQWGERNASSPRQCRERGVRHVFTSREQVGTGEPVTICSNCGARV